VESGLAVSVSFFFFFFFFFFLSFFFGGGVLFAAPGILRCAEPDGKTNAKMTVLITCRLQLRFDCDLSSNYS